MPTLDEPCPTVWAFGLECVHFTEQFDKKQMNVVLLLIATQLTLAYPMLGNLPAEAHELEAFRFGQYLLGTTKGRLLGEILDVFTIQADGRLARQLGLPQTIIHEHCAEHFLKFLANV